MGLLINIDTVSYTHLRAHETGRNLVCRLLLEKKKTKKKTEKKKKENQETYTNKPINHINNIR